MCVSEIYIYSYIIVSFLFSWCRRLTDLCSMCESNSTVLHVCFAALWPSTLPLINGIILWQWRPTLTLTAWKLLSQALYFSWTRESGWSWRQMGWMKKWSIWWLTPAGPPISLYQMEAWDMTSSWKGLGNKDLIVTKTFFVVAGCSVIYLLLLLSSCPNPADSTVKMVNNGLGVSNYFSFNMFQFAGKTGDVYLHCKLELCVRQDNNCEPVCIVPIHSHKYPKKQPKKK